MVNYVLSFCKITGASKIFKRNFYLPLLKPLTPKEALRTLRITGKWLLGAKRQHYIPVLLNHTQKRSKKSKCYGKRNHEEMEDYTYMTPVFDHENENQKVLLKLLDSKKATGVFVYTVEDKKYNIVLQAQIEVAIRDGDIIDILVSQKNDKIIIKMRDLKKVPMEIQYYDGTEEMYQGEGATSPEEEKFHHHGKYTMSLAKIFEDKERVEEEWEEALKKIMRRRKKQKYEGTKEWKEMVKQSMKNLDWKKFEEDAKQVIQEISEPLEEQPLEMDIDDLETTKNVNETILKHGPDLLNQLPTLKEIPDIIKNMGNASLHDIEDKSGTEEFGDESKKRRRVSGVTVKLESGKECFVSGQMVHTDEGDVFVPGQTIENEFGEEYAPGITINVDNKPTLIKGLIMGEEDRNPMFLPTQSTITSDGQLTFATTSEERPEPQPEKQKIRRKRLLEMKKIIEGIIEEEVNENENGEFEEIQIEICGQLDEMIDDTSLSIPTSDDESSEVDEKSIETSSIELNKSEFEELDMEEIRLKQEQQRLEIEKLKQILMDDGMDDIIASLEDKKAKLKQKLEELRKLNISKEYNLITFVNENDAYELASKISHDAATINRISDVLLTMTRRAATFRDKNSIISDNINNQIFTNITETDEKFNACSNKLKILLKTAIVAANDVFKNRPKDQLLGLNSIGDIVSDVFKNDQQVLQEMFDIMNTSNERNEVCNTIFRQLTQVIPETKLSMLKAICSSSLSDILDITVKILGKENDLSTSLTKIVKVSPEIIKLIKENLQKNISQAKSEDDAEQILSNCIVDASKEMLKDKFEEMINEAKKDKLLEFINETLSFAKALSYDNIVDELSEVTVAKNIKYCQVETKDMLKRMILIKQLAEKDYSLKTAILRIQKNPEAAKSDPRIRQLIRESALLTNHRTNLKNSRDIPLKIMKNRNLLSLEDFLVKTNKTEFPVFISRSGFEAVIPKEATRSVMSGRIPYVLIDESGVSNMKPLNFSRTGRDNRIGDYLSRSSSRERSMSIEKDDSRKYLQAKNNGSDGSWGTSRSRRTMSSAPLYRGYTGPRA